MNSRGIQGRGYYDFSCAGPCMKDEEGSSGLALGAEMTEEALGADDELLPGKPDESSTLDPVGYSHRHRPRPLSAPHCH